MRLILVCLTMLIVGAGCSKSPKNYNSTPPVNNQPNPQELPAFGDLSKPTTVTIAGKPVISSEHIDDNIPGEDDLNVGSIDFDTKVKFNSSQPIVYSSGAAGLTPLTSLTDAETLLSTPRSPPDANGETLYDEGIYVRWRLDEPRTPVFVLVLSSYLGKIQMPSPMSPIGLNHDFSKQYATNSKSSAEQMARDYYRIFEKADAAFDCIPQGYCSVDWGPDEQKNFVINYPGMTMLISKDRFVMFRVMIIPKIPLGILANDVDVLNGSFEVPGEKAIAMGDTFADVEARWAATAPAGVLGQTSVGNNYFGRTYAGAYLSYGKTAFDRASTEPKPTDRVKAIQVYGDYKNILKVGNLPIVVSVYQDRSDVRIGTATETTEVNLGDHVDKPLQINLGMPRAHVKAFTEKLQVLLTDEFKKAYPTYEVSSHFTGAFQKKQIKDYTMFVIAYDKAAQKGIFSQFTMGEEQGNLSSVYITTLGGEYNGFANFKSFDTLVMTEFNTPVVKPTGARTYTELSGMKIGDKIEITDWDLGRSEGTISLVGSTIKERGTYYDRDVETFAFSSDKAVKQELASAYITSLNVSLGMSLIEQTATSRIYRVDVVRSALKLGEIQGLCGGALKATIGMNDIAFKKELEKVPECVTFSIYDSEGNGRLSSVHFPNDQIRLTFSDFEITMATIYSPVGGVQ